MGEWVIDRLKYFFWVDGVYFWFVVVVVEFGKWFFLGILVFGI